MAKKKNAIEKQWDIRCWVLFSQGNHSLITIFHQLKQILSNWKNQIKQKDKVSSFCIIETNWARAQASLDPVMELMYAQAPWAFVPALMPFFLFQLLIGCPDMIKALTRLKVEKKGHLLSFKFSNILLWMMHFFYMFQLFCFGFIYQLAYIRGALLQRAQSDIPETRKSHDDWYLSSEINCCIGGKWTSTICFGFVSKEMFLWVGVC